MLMKDRIPGNTLSLVSSVCPSVCFVISFDSFMVTESNSKVFLSAVVLTETEARFISFSYSDGGYKRSFKKPRELVKNVSRLRFPHLFVNAGSCLTCFYAWDWLILKAVHILERNQAAHLRYRSDSVFSQNCHHQCEKACETAENISSRHSPNLPAIHHY